MPTAPRGTSSGTRLRKPLLPLLLGLFLGAAPDTALRPALGGAPRDALDGALRACEDDLAAAAAAMFADDDRTAVLRLGDADQDARAAAAALRDVAPPAMVRDLRPALDDLRRRIGRAADAALASTDAAGGDLAALRSIGRAARTLAEARRRLGPVEDFLAIEAGRTVLVHEPGGTAAIRVRVRDAQGAPPEVRLADDGGGAVTEGPPGDDAPGVRTFQLTGTAGVAVVRVTSGELVRDVRIVNVGPPGTLDLAPPRDFSYAESDVESRAGAAIALAASVSGDALAFSVAPALPAGLALDPDTGEISGSADAASGPTIHTVTAGNARGSALADVTLTFDPALPEGVDELEPGFDVGKVTDAFIPVRMALLPDGRILYGELLTGNVRLVSAGGVLDPSPVLTVPVVTGGERGFLGIAAAPDFAASGRIYVTATAAAGDGHAERTRVLRYALTPTTGTLTSVAGPEVVVDDLPSGILQNGGAVEFGPDGFLYVTIGDTGDAALAQTQGSLAGRILRYTADGAIPSSNPDPASPEFARGLRNPFDLTFHAPTGGLFVSENGPTAHDELNFVQPGRNCQWGADDPESVPGPQRGRRIIDWTPVIVPTGIVFHDGTGFGPEYDGVLFVAGYDQGDVRTLRLSGPQHADLDEERPFLRFTESGISGKPLDLQRGGDGSLYVATFAAIWRVTRYR